MDKKVVEGYALKLGVLLEACLSVNTVLESDIRPANKDNPLHAAFWWQGAKNGVLLMFIGILTLEEHEINSLVLDRVKGEGGDEARIDPDDYIETAVSILDELGYHIPVEQLRNGPDSAVWMAIFS